MSKRRTPPEPEPDYEREVLKLKLQVSEMREEIQMLRGLNCTLQEAMRENSRVFAKLKPSRPPLSHDAKLLIAGEQKFCCAAPHGKELCPMWRLPGNNGSFGIFGWEVDHVIPFSKSHRNAGNVVAICHACHGLKCRYERIAALEADGEEREDAE